MTTAVERAVVRELAPDHVVVVAPSYDSYVTAIKHHSLLSGGEWETVWRSQADSGVVVDCYRL